MKWPANCRFSNTSSFIRLPEDAISYSPTEPGQYVAEIRFQSTRLASTQHDRESPIQSAKGIKNAHPFGSYAPVCSRCAVNFSSVVWADWRGHYVRPSSAARL